jgi:hypothetical protein
MMSKSGKKQAFQSYQAYLRSVHRERKESVPPQDQVQATARRIIASASRSDDTDELQATRAASLIRS